jgi:hypothetical protein
MSEAELLIIIDYPTDSIREPLMLHPIHYYLSYKLLPRVWLSSCLEEDSYSQAH